MDDGDIVSIPTRREAVQEIIDGKRDRHLFGKKLGIGEYVEFFSAPPIHFHQVVENYPEPDAIRVMVIVSETTEASRDSWFFRWKAAVPYQQSSGETTVEEETFLILDALRRFSEGTDCDIPALPVSRVTGLPLQLVEDSFELLAGDGYLLHDHDSGGHTAELKAKGRQFLREHARRRTATDDPIRTSSAKEDGVTNPSPEPTVATSNETSQAAKSIGRPLIGPGNEFQVVLLIHGIRTQADWGPMVKSKLEVPGQIEVIPIKYGYFDAFRFWFPFRTRNRPIERVYTQIRVARQKDPHAKLSIIAHSFGTYIIGQILKRGFDLHIHRLILCGSVLPQNFPWHEYQGRFDDDKLVNECGKADIWPVLAQSTSWGYGASGTHGFGAVLVKDRHHEGGHGQYFDPKFVESYWEPFIRRGEYRRTDFEKDAPDSLVDLGSRDLAAALGDPRDHPNALLRPRPSLPPAAEPFPAHHASISPTKGRPTADHRGMDCAYPVRMVGDPDHGGRQVGPRERQPAGGIHLERRSFPGRGS